jgi:predicted ATPase
MDFLPGLLEIAAEDSPERRLARLEEFCTRHGLSSEEGLPLLASLLSISAAHRYPLPPMSPERQKQRTLEVLLGIVLALAGAQPVVIVVEDLHWIDPTTLELLTLLLAQAPSARLFVLLTARLTFKPPWPPHSHITPLTLNRYTRRQASLLVERLIGGKRLPAEVVEQIVGKTDGVPLFIEELTKMVLESGLLVSREDGYQLTGPLPPLAIPSTLQGSLTARLDLLGTAKPVAQVCAAIGRAVPYSLLRVLIPVDEAALARELARLVDAELLNQRGVAPDVVYVFKHVLLQEAAYQSLLKSVRQQYHERIAGAMVERFSSEAQLHPEFVAAHYTEAGNARQAIRWWQLAGQQAVQRAAYAEAIAHYGRALAVVTALPASPQRDEAELALRVALGYASIPVHGWAAAETAQAFTRAGELCDQSGESPELFRALWGLGAFHFVRGDQRQARTVADQCMEVARKTGDVDALIEAHYLGGIVSSVQGAFTSAREDLEQLLQLYGPHKRELHTAQYGQDPKPSALGWLAMDLWALGFPDRGLQCAREALAFVEQGTHPFTLARALAGVGFVHVYRREPQPGNSKLAAAIALCVEQNFAYFRAVVSSFEGSNQVLLGRTQEGIALMRQSVAELRTIGSELLFTVIFGHLANAHLGCGQIAEGLAAVNEGLALVERNEEHWGEAELHRLKGELFLQRAPDDWEPAQACFERAIEVSVQQSARSYELRAAISLARLWQRLGRRADARGCVGARYEQFSEGLDTPDLREAASLLQQLR